MKKIAIGLENFKDTVKQCYYVDKTQLIKRILELPIGTSILFSRPRRFGKSLALSMLKTFFEESEDDPKQYFEGLGIAKENQLVRQHMGQYQVIYLNMKDVSGENRESLISKCKQVVQKEISRHSKIKEKLDKEGKKQFDQLLDPKISDIEFSSSILTFCQLISNIEKNRPIILMDEYDAPLQSAYEGDFYPETKEFFRRFYSESFKGNSNYTYSILTGVTRAGKLSFFSGLNNLLVDTVVDHHYSDCFGFLKKETLDLLTYYHRESEMANVEKYYGGYHFGDDIIYNPWSTLNFIANEGRYKPYWVATSSLSLIRSIIQKNYLDLALSMQDLIAGKETIAEIDESINYEDIGISESSILSFLLFMGYLTIKKEMDNVSFLGFPNEETRGLFLSEVRDALTNKGGLKIGYELKRSFLEGDSKSFSSLLEEYILSSLSYFDFGNEKNYQVMLLTLFSLLFEKDIVKSEANIGSGRCDILIASREEKGFSAVIEVKYLSSRTSKERLLASSRIALEQIKKKEYASNLVEKSKGNVFAYGVSFCQNHVAIQSEKLK